MKKIFGIIHSEADNYILATLGTDKKHTWQISHIREWDSQNIWKRILLLSRGINYGVTSWWKPTTEDDNQTLIEYAQYPTEEKYNGTSPYTIIAHSADCEIHKENFRTNLISMVPEDGFLAAIPLTFFPNSDESFLSIFANGEFYKIGITIKKQLFSVYQLAPGNTSALPGHLGRIERYWNNRFNSLTFPQTIYVMGDPEYTPEQVFDSPIKRWENNYSLDELKAIGTALTQEKNCVPSFAPATPESSFRKLRTWTYGFSLALILLSLLAIAGFWGMEKFNNQRKDTFEKEYQRVIANNQEIKKLIARSNDLAETIVRLEQTFSRQTIWGKFLHEIGKARPDGLFFERFGSDPVKNQDKVIRVAITGWTAKEKLVTHFIKKLQNMPFVTHITLSSLERDKKRHSIYGFKIICTLLLSGQ